MGPPSLDPELARRLEALDSVWVHPRIPARKIRNARSAHRIPDDEPIWALYDDTLLGGGADGIVLTPERFSTKAAFEPPRPVPYSALGPVEAAGKTLEVAGLRLSFATWTPEHAHVLADVLESLRRPPNETWEAAVLRELTAAIGGLDETFLAPSIPKRKERAVRELHRIPHDERILAVFDDTVFGGAREGWVFTTGRVAWKDIFEDPAFQAWGEVSTSLPAGPRNLDPHLSDLLAAIWRHRGLLEPRNLELEARIHADLDDPEPRLVLADWLLERQHPRGTLIALHAEDEDPDVHLAHHPLTLGATHLYDGPRVRWRLGYWRTVTLDGGEQFFESPRWLDRMLTHPSARFLEHLSLEGTPELDEAVTRRALEQLADWRVGYRTPTVTVDGAIVIQGSPPEPG